MEENVVIEYKILCTMNDYCEISNPLIFADLLNEITDTIRYAIIVCENRAERNYISHLFQKWMETMMSIVHDLRTTKKAVSVKNVERLIDITDMFMDTIADVKTWGPKQNLSNAMRMTFELLHHIKYDLQHVIKKQ